MDVTWIELRHVWILAGPVTSALVLRTASLKYHQSNTILRKYESNDVCIFFQFWVHFITNVTFAVLNIPQVEAFVTCTVRKWILLWVASMTFFNNLPSLLDFCMRTNNTHFYQAFFLFLTCLSFESSNSKTSRNLKNKVTFHTIEFDQE